CTLITWVKKRTTPSRPDAALGLCWMYLSVSHSPERSHWLHCSSSRMMCSAACLLRFKAGSLSLKSDSGSATPTTGSCANAAELRTSAKSASSMERVFTEASLPALYAGRARRYATRRVVSELGAFRCAPSSTPTERRSTSSPPSHPVNSARPQPANDNASAVVSEQPH